MALAAPSLDLVLRDIGPDDITPHFQPILDVFTAAIVGYEVLARGPAPFQAPSPLFARARELGLTEELERSCRTATLARIRSLRGNVLARDWFVNISPEVLCLGDAAAMAAEVRAAGLDPACIVLEMTERDVMDDHERLQQAVRAHAGEGFRIALDDFGSGNSGLIALVSCMPHIIKLDMEITREVNAHPYKQNVVRSIVALATSVNARLIAEGVETWQELEMLVRQGVRFAQGQLFAAPTMEPATLRHDVTRMLRRTISRCSPTRSNVEEAIARLSTETFSLQRGSMLCGELEAVFHDDPALDCAVVLDGTDPVGVITRTHLLAQMSGRFGYALASHKPIDAVVKALTLVVDEGASIVRLATLAMERCRDDLYDPVVIVRNGAYCGTVTMKQLIMRAAELELEHARDCNPLTLLPGNRQIQTWISEALESGGTLLYADLDRFKEFNDAFGFVLGDEAIRLTAQILASQLEELCPGTRLGHLGGDDFVLVAPGAIEEHAVVRICNAFDAAIRTLFDQEIVLTGEFRARDRRGKIVWVPITTLSIAIVGSRALGRSIHQALLSQAAAALKKRAKEISAERGRSSFAVERRGP